MHKIRQSLGYAAVAAALFGLAVSSARAGEDKNPNPQKERELIEVLRADGAKAIACKQLAVYGTKESVPELARLLSDERLASWARIALEAIPDPACDEALRGALGKLQGKLLVGTINSISVRRDAAAVDLLIARLPDQDAEVASAAAVALGHIGNPAATAALRKALPKSPAKVRPATAEGCVLCAERLLADGHADEAAAIYDEVRRAELPKQKILEGTHGAILARMSQGKGGKAAGIALLLEQLRSPDKKLFQLGLTTAREIPGREVADALAAELAGAPPERSALYLIALADRHDTAVLPAVLQAVRSGPKPVRIAAMSVLPRLGDASCVASLLEISTDGDAELAQAAKDAIAGLPGEKVDSEITSRLAKASGKTLPVLLGLVGQRRIEALPQLQAALDNSDAAVRGAALTALGATVGPKDLSILITRVVEPKHPGDLDAAKLALRTACVRMPDREACAAALGAAMPQASAANKASLLEIAGVVGGTKALQLLGEAAKTNDPQLADTASRALGEWMDVDAAATLLELAKTVKDDKYQVRALRGYIRLARQFAASDAQRVEVCQKAFEASKRDAEQKLVLEVLGRSATLDALKLAVQATETPALKEDATRVSLAIAQKMGDKAPGARELVAKIHLDPVKLEIVKAEYGAGTTQKDVTEPLKRLAKDVQLITLPSANYADNLGGDPFPGTAKKLTIQYRINGKPGEASFPDNAVILLPMPK